MRVIRNTIHNTRTLTALAVFYVVSYHLTFGAPPTQAQNPLKFNTVFELLDALLAALILIVFPIVVLLIVYTGFLFVTAQGNSSKLDAAKKALLWTIVGALVVLGSRALSLAIRATVEEVRTGAAAMVPSVLPPYV